MGLLSNIVANKEIKPIKINQVISIVFIPLLFLASKVRDKL